MSLYPPVTFSLTNGFLLIIPLLLLRFGIPALVKRGSGNALDYFAPVKDREQIALRVYLVTNTFLIFSPLLARIVGGTPWAIAGWVSYLAGVMVLGLALIHFSTSPRDRVVQTGIYRLSRNPIYVGYFLIFIGVSFLIGSWFHLSLTLIYQVAVHILILSEERWCCSNFGQEFLEYRSRVRRYF